MEMETNFIGLERKKLQTTVAQLNDLLASYMVFYQNVRGLHWNVRGGHFFTLHQKYEELYHDLQEKVDSIAERILTLGEIPLHSCDDYRTVSKIRHAKNISDGNTGVQTVLTSLQTLLEKQRGILKLAHAADDEGTATMMSDYIAQQEKLVWMYAAFLNQ